MNKYDRKHIANVRAYQRQIDQIFKIAAEESAALAAGLSAPDDGVFSFSSVPRLQKAIDILQAQMATRLQKTVVDGVNAEWALSNNKNDALVDSVLPESSRKARYYRTNNEARDAFIARKEGGMNLSDRVWHYTDQFKQEIEMGIDCGLRDGLDADAMSRQLKQYLQHPDKLYRRVRDEHGVLQLSKAAAAYHPGQGVYRSSYKNARRLAATETNIAYRTADHERWQQLDFIVGIEIHLSNNHTCLDRKGKPKPFYDICDELKGEYPKDFKFTGWHPHCRCIATTIFKTEEEMAADEERILNGETPSEPNTSKNAVNELPDNFNKWVEENKGRKARSMPYFLRDNATLIDGGSTKSVVANPNGLPGTYTLYRIGGTNTDSGLLFTSPSFEYSDHYGQMGSHEGEVTLEYKVDIKKPFVIELERDVFKDNTYFTDEAYRKLVGGRPSKVQLENDRKIAIALKASDYDAIMYKGSDGRVLEVAVKPGMLADGKKTREPTVYSRVWGVTKEEYIEDTKKLYVTWGNTEERALQLAKETAEEEEQKWKDGFYASK